jgi:glucosamine-6-phosphate deaminase
MRVRVFADEGALGRAAATHAADFMMRAIAASGKARILAAAGESQRGLLDSLAASADIAWAQVELFHDSEYLGLAAEHPASCRRFLCDRLIGKTRIGRCHLLDGQRDPERVCRDEGDALRAAPIDVAFVSVGGNGALALNFPPADFATEKPFFVARLDESWRRERVQEGKFASLGEAPESAITISIRLLLKAAALIVCAGGADHAAIVKRCVEGAVSPLVPASILQTHGEATLYLDRHSAAGLTQRPATED